MAKKRKGVPSGFQHNWAYRGHWKEKKVRPGYWIIDFRATKRTKAGSMGPKPGSFLVWKIDATQTAYKTHKGSYQTRLTGKKTLLKSKMKGGKNGLENK